MHVRGNELRRIYLLRLYEKGWRASQVQVLMAKNSEKSISLCSLVGLWSLLLGLIRTFHTVSEVEFSEVHIPHSPGAIQQGFLCGASERRSPIYIRPR